jgi:hypothetical protein
MVTITVGHNVMHPRKQVLSSPLVTVEMEQNVGTISEHMARLTSTPVRG